MGRQRSHWVLPASSSPFGAAAQHWKNETFRSLCGMPPLVPVDPVALSVDGPVLDPDLLRREVEVVGDDQSLPGTGSTRPGKPPSS